MICNHFLAGGKQQTDGQTDRDFFIVGYPFNRGNKGMWPIFHTGMILFTVNKERTKSTHLKGTEEIKCHCAYPMNYHIISILVLP